MKITDRDLLRRAFPRGYAARRGIMSIGGWQCIAEAFDGSALPEGKWIDTVGVGIDLRDSRNYQWGQALSRGDLLPNVDIEDTATWANLMQMLVEELFADVSRVVKPLRGCALDAPSNYGELWSIGVATNATLSDLRFCRLPVVYGDAAWWAEAKEFYPDWRYASLVPEEVLVYSLIELNEAEGA